MNNHHDECPAREITCVHCNTTLSRSELTTHLSTCHHVPIPCAHSSQGCQWIGTRQIIDQHLQVCPYEAIKGFFTVTATKFQALELENSELRKRLSDLERTCKSQEQDLERAKQRLGTWFKPVSSGAQGIASDSAYNLPRPESSSTIRRTGRRLSAPLHAALFSDQPQATEPADTSTAGFFPESQILDSSAGPAGATVIPSLRSQPSMPYMRQGGNGSTTSIAPLNFDTTLEATLTSLRNSVVALSSSLDSLERKQDIMLATETLRMHEDVGSLRAIVHGLRMQVHTMMMDRNSQLYGRMGVMGPSSNVLPITGGPNSSDLDLEPIASVADGTVSSAARYLNHPPPAHFNLSPNVTTSTTSTVRRGFLHENKL
ncbi:hypothetical protein FRC02_009914 [Tulasnella sp. 418]|nr:hypothetical protein FRC02_009914 [Tulasnella sp. 418]